MQMFMKYNNNVKGFMLCVLGVLSFSTKAIFAKLAYNHGANANEILYLRMLFSLPFYIIFLIFYYSKGKEAKVKKNFFYIILLGIIGYYLSSLFDFKGLEYIDASLERMILFLFPVFTMLINYIFLKQKPNKKQITGSIFIYIGIFVIFFRDLLTINNLSKNYFIGIFYIILCAILYGGYISFSKKTISTLGSNLYTSLVMIISCICLILNFWILEQKIWPDVNNNVLIYGVLVAIISTVLPTFLISRSIELIGSNNTALIGSLGPISTISLAIFFLGESIFINQILGSLLIIISTLYINFSLKKWLTEKVYKKISS